MGYSVVAKYVECPSSPVAAAADATHWPATSFRGFDVVFFVGFWVQVELLRNQQGLLHVSNMTDRNPAPPARELVQQGQPVLVRVIEVDR